MRNPQTLIIIKTKLNSTTMKKVLIFIMSVFVLTSCSDKEEVIGKWDDNIKLSQKSAKFSYETDSITINTQGNGWWINSVEYSDSVYYPAVPYDLPFEPVTIKGNSFLVEHRDKKTLFIKMEENNTGIKRELKIVVQGGNYFDYVYISQSAKPTHNN